MPVNSQTKTKLDKRSLVSRVNGSSSLANLRSLVEALELESLTLTGDLVVTGSVTAGSIAGANAFADGTAAAPSISNTGDTDTGLYFSAANQVAVTTGGTGQVIFTDGTIQPVTDNDIDLGTASLEFKDLYIDGTANIDSLVADTVDINGGTIDGTNIGNSSPAVGVFTSTNVTGTASANYVTAAAGISAGNTVNSILKTDLVTLTATEIVGTDAGDIGHAAGAVLVAAQAGVVHEFISATLIYDFDTAAYTGGNNDLVIRQGTTAVSAAIADADLVGDTADDIAYVNALAAADIKLTANSTINLAGTAYTQPGTAAGVLRVYVTYRSITTGL